jgi:hypothetical protein
MTVRTLVRTHDLNDLAVPVTFEEQLNTGNLTSC